MNRLNIMRLRRGFVFKFNWLESELVENLKAMRAFGWLIVSRRGVDHY